MLSSVRKWLFTTASASRRRNRKVLAFEVLEDRRVPATRLVTQLLDPVGVPTHEDPDPMTLRRAINELNGFPNETNTITFRPGLQGDVTLAFALPAVVVNISIDGTVLPNPDPRIGVVRAAANPAHFRIFEVAAAGTLSLLDLRISGGYDDVGGGGILVNSGTTLYLQNSAVYNNTAFAQAIGVAGGGIENNGTTTCYNSTITGNWASDFGGGIYNAGSLSIFQGSTFAGNHADSDGGAIFNEGGASVQIYDSQIEGNWAGDAGAQWRGRGGGIFNLGTLQMSDSTLNGNSVYFNSCRGGGVYCDGASTATLSNVAVNGNSARNGNNDGRGGGFYLAAGAALSMSNCTLSGNLADIALSVGGWKEPGSTFSWIGDPPADPIGPPT